MNKFLFFSLVIISNVFASSANYIPADFSRWDRPIVQIKSPFSQERMGIRINTTQQINAYDSANNLMTLPKDTQLIMDITLKQAYEGFRNPLMAEFLFSKDQTGEWMSPAAVQIQDIMKELIEFKMLENTMNYTTRGRPSAARDELVSVRIKKEGELKEKVKVNLKEANEKGALKVEEDEILSARIPTDYNGQENWSVTPKSEATDLFKCLDCTLKGTASGVLKQTEAAGILLEQETVNQVISKKFAAYSMDPKTGVLVSHVKKHVRDPIEYKKSKQKWCYRYSKDSLVASKLVSKRLDGVIPRFAGEQLEKEGFTNIMDDPELKGRIKDPTQAPKGAILVYEPVPSNRLVRWCDTEEKRCMDRADYGHIEIKTEHVGKSGFASDYYSTTARTGRSLESVDRKLIGIYVKDPGKGSN